MHRFSRIAALLVAVFICLAAANLDVSPGLAQEATPAATGVVLPPEAEVAGFDLAEWSARSWQWFFSLPAAVNPFFDVTGGACGFGQHGPVFFLAGAESSLERSCVIPQGVHVFVPLIGSECSTVEPPPFFGRDETELRRCATEAIDHAASVFDMTAMRLTVDGETVDDLSSYRALTPLFPLWLPQDNLLESDQTVAGSVADGYQVLLRPFAPGDHEVVITPPVPQGGEPVTITYILAVVSGTDTETTDSTPTA